MCIYILCNVIKKKLVNSKYYCHFRITLYNKIDTNRQFFLSYINMFTYNLYNTQNKDICMKKHGLKINKHHIVER